MKYLKLLNILPISFFIFALLALPAMAATHTMTGNINTDWGVNLNQAYAEDAVNSSNHINGASKYWIPSSSTADYVIENNIDPRFYSISPNLHDWTGYNSTGTHLVKNGTMQYPARYIENMLSSYYQPAGGEPFDIEALYFDNNKTDVFIAVVTSMNQNGYNLETQTGGYENGALTDGHVEAGDIAIDLDNNPGTGTGGYEYAIITHVDNVNTNYLGHLIFQPTWRQTDPGFTAVPPNDADFATGSVDKGAVSLSYNQLGISETVNYDTTVRSLSPLKEKRTVTKNLIEIRIPRSYLNSPSDDTLSNIHATIGCGNDYIELTPVRFKADIPEFPSIVLPVAAVMGVILIMGRRKKE